jgi:hypothetical protein
MSEEFDSRVTDAIIFQNQEGLTNSAGLRYNTRYLPHQASFSVQSNKIPSKFTHKNAYNGLDRLFVLV